MSDIGKVQSPDSAGWYVRDSSGTARQVANSSGVLYSAGEPINTLPVSETTTVNLANYGVSLTTYSTAANTYTLAAPQAGVRKFIAINSTLIPDTTAIFVAIYSGSTATLIAADTTAYAANLYVGLQPPTGYVEMVGVSASQWQVVAASTHTKFSTSASFSS